MNRKQIYMVIGLAAMVGCFFQYNRMDGFLHWSRVENRILISGKSQGVPGSAVQREKYVLLYDAGDVGSVLTAHMVEKILQEEKKEVITVKAREQVTFDESYRGVLVVSSHITSMPSYENLLSYARQGGTVVLFQHPDEGDLDLSLDALMGVHGGKNKTAYGLEVMDSFLLGANHVTLGKDRYSTDTLDVTLKEGAHCHIRSADGIPLLWDTSYGEGKVIVYNGMARDEKDNYGIYTAMINHCGEDSLYPVLGKKVFFIDDFPAPTPEGNFEKIYDEYHMTTAAFYRKVWWPYMLKLGKDYDLKYTGLIIETYGNQVKGPFHPLSGRAARDNVIVYGRELLAAGGELGIHGYNHQSLAPAGYNQEALEYVPWESEADMEEAVSELHRYVKELYPEYEFRTYVPPSNILSPEGYEAVKRGFPEIKIFASLWDGLGRECYYQDFGIAKDGMYYIPRISAGYAPDDHLRWAAINGINYMGIFSHFVHPDELFYEESKDLSWQDMVQGMNAFMGDMNHRYPWLQGSTASEAADAMNDYVHFDYTVEREADHLTIYMQNFRKPMSFILRSQKKVQDTKGCQVTMVDDGAYYVQVTDHKAVIQWKEETP